MKTIPVTIDSLADIITKALAESKISTDFEAIITNSAGLIDKIGKQTTFEYDSTPELTWMDGERLELGRTIEEFEKDFPMPMKEGADTSTDTPYFSTYRKPSYSYAMKPKNWRVSYDYDDLQVAFINQGGLSREIAKIQIDTEVSVIDYRNQVKKSLLGAFAMRAKKALDNAKTYAPTTAYEIGEYVKNGTNYAVVFQKKDTTSKTWDVAVKEGIIVPVHYVSTLAMPVDTETATKAIKEFKGKVIEATRRNAENLNGSFMPSIKKGLLKLVILESAIPSVDVDAMAGAFNPDKLGLGIDIETVETFGEEADKAGIWAILLDSRGAKLHPCYDRTVAVQNINHFMTWDRKTVDTGFYGANTYIHVFTKA